VLSATLDFSADQIRGILANLHKLPAGEQAKTLELLTEIADRKSAANSRISLLAFAQRMAPVLQIETEPKVFMVGPHHKKIAALMGAVARGEKKRIMISIAPRMGKSLLSSYLFPAWYLGQFPNRRLIMASHTADLAVGFGRKIRDLVNTAEYRTVFPKVELKMDSKAAGQWATNDGGEFFACITPDTLIDGVTAACDICVGDRLSTGVVLNVFHSTHKSTVTLNQLRCSSKHPIWVFSRGWIAADEASINDLLHVESIYDIMQAFLRSLYDYIMEHLAISALVQHKIKMLQSTERKMARLRGSWDNGVRKVADICKLCLGYGAAADTAAYGRSRGQYGSLQSGELPLGYADRAGEQQAQYCAVAHQGGDSSVSYCCTFGGGRAWDPTVSYKTDGARSRGCHTHGQRPEEELESPDTTVNHGWLRRTAAWLYGRCCSERQPGKPRRSAESHLARARETAEDLFGLLLGVRRITQLDISTHEPRPFINFHVSRTNAFIASGILTHNCGIGGALAGRGANLVVIDDPFSEDIVRSGNTQVFEEAYNWFQTGPLQRLAPDGAVIIIHTRWSKLDLIGKLQAKMASDPEAEQWEVVEFPAIFGEGEDQKSLWPERWPLNLLLQKKANMAPQFWNAQYMQNPTGEAGALIKREWWNDWEKEDPPNCEYLIMGVDAAQETNNRADYTAWQVWGVFYDEREKANIICLDAWKQRLEYPELKKAMLEEYKRWEVDTFVIEKKSSGSVLFQELRNMGVPVSEFTPGRGQDKIARVNSVTDIFTSGLVWIPKSKRWAMELIEECSDFPNGDHDDQVDCATLILRRFRTGGFIRLDTDEKDEESGWKRKRTYY
jgi:predicted phage terminase large subunit-like protein